MTQYIEGLDGPHRGRIEALRETGRFAWIDVALSETSPDDLGATLGVPQDILEPLFDFDRGHPPSRKFRADGEHLVFVFGCYLRSKPVEVHVLVTGDYLLTLHREHLSLPKLLDPAPPEGRSDQYVAYAILDAMVAKTFDALYEAELILDNLTVSTTDLRGGPNRMSSLREVSGRLSGMRRRAGPQRSLFERVGVEITGVKGLEGDGEPYFERIGEQLDRLVEGIDAATQATGMLTDLRLNETIYWLTVVATVFLPLTFITGFFGMNFGWMVGEIDSAWAFWLVGMGTLLLGAVLIWVLVVRSAPVDGLQSPHERRRQRRTASRA